MKTIERINIKELKLTLDEILYLIDNNNIDIKELTRKKEVQNIVELMDDKNITLLDVMEEQFNYDGCNTSLIDIIDCYLENCSDSYAEESELYDYIISKK